MSKSKITLSLEELNTPTVDEKVQQQTALNSAAANSQRAAAAPSRLPIPDASGSIWYNTIFSMTVFGLLGGIFAWGLGEGVRFFNPDRRAQARDLWQADLQLLKLEQTGRTSSTAAKVGHDEIRAEGKGNPWFELSEDRTLSEDARKAAFKRLDTQYWIAKLITDIGLYGACGICIAMALGLADAVTSRNFRSAIIYGSVGALLGLVGGVVVSLFADPLFKLLSGDPNLTQPSLGGQMLARSIAWAVLGLFISAAPGIVMGSARKLKLGLIGGLAGGLLGGALFDPVLKSTDLLWLSRLVAIAAIGMITGLSTGLIENAAKAGWLKVVAGLIAGKQFILYRNPTFIGAAPQCEIYLFKDGKVGRRHAAVYIQTGYYEIEDLGTGAKTFVNGKPITRAKLRSGDQIQIGSTSFSFQEKAKA